MDYIYNGVWKKSFGEPEKYTPLSLAKTMPREDALKNISTEGKTPLLDEDIQCKITAKGCIIEIPLKADEKIYGFGLQLKKVNHTGTKKHLRTNADPVANTGDTHAPVPFYVSTRGYGVLIDTARYLSFYCGSSTKLKQGRDLNEVSKKEIANNTDDLYKTDSISEEKSILIEVPYAKGIQIYVFEGPDMKTAVQRYNLFSGGGCLPPLWGLGILYRTYGRADMSEVLDLAKNFRDNKIPCDIIGIEPGWQSHSYSCSYTWDKERFPDPDKMIQELKEMNYNINLWEHVFVHPSSPLYHKLKPYSGDYEVWNGLVPDLSLVDASDSFAEFHKTNLMDRGIDGFKLDECDSSDYTGDWSFPNSSAFPSGLDGEQMHSMLGIFYQKSILKAVEKRKKRTYGQVRASHALASSLPFVLYSDLYEHQDFIRGVINSGFSGLLWTPEVRQCQSVEELVRRIQTVIFSAQACINAWMIPHPPWFQYDYHKNLNNESAENWQEVQALCRKFFELRMSFVPYLYSSFVNYYREGVPPFRALVMDYPEDVNTYDIEDEYMMGETVLVAPMLAGVNKRKVYLPEGNWYCFWENKIYTGRNTYEIKCNLDRIPLFIKENSLLPLAKPLQSISKDVCFDISVRCYGDKSSQFTLYEDDGISYDFYDGKYNKLKLIFDNEDSYRFERIGNIDMIRYRINEWLIL
ncbi:MAG: TIM-barrel domain-containing protein [Halanaerobiales bacterium]